MKRTEKGKWVAVIEDISMLNTPETLQARNALEQLILGNNNQFHLVDCMRQSININEADQFISSLVNIFQRYNKMRGLWEFFVKNEIENSSSSGTLFRSNSQASKLLSCYSNMLGREYIVSVLKGPLEKVFQYKDLMELDPQKTDPANLKMNQIAFIKICESFLSSIIDSFKVVPGFVIFTLIFFIF